MIKLYIFNESDKEQSFDFVDDAIYVGRSPDNNIQMKDRTVSRRHLEIIKRADKYVIKDLKSKNGTYVNGNYINPGIECEINEGVPIVIGMSVICLGEGCLESVAPFLESINLSRELIEDVEVIDQHRSMTDQKNIELLHNVNDLLMESQDINVISEKILDYLLTLLKRIDRGVIILINNESEDDSEIIISRTRKTIDDTDVMFSRPVVDQVMQNKKAVLISDVHNAEEVDLSETLKLLKIRSVMCVPLISGSRVLGVIYVDSLKKPYGFRKEDLSLLTDLSKQTALTLENALYYSNSKK